MFVILILIALLAVMPSSVAALDVTTLTQEVESAPITATEVPQDGTTEASVGITPDGTKPSKEEMAKEFSRRSKKFAEFPQTNIPGEMFLYSEMSMSAPKLVIPTSELLRVVKNRGEELGFWAQVYCPYWDKVGYIDTMQACAYKGVTSVDFNKVNFKMYSNGVGFTNGSEEYNFPASPDWGDVKNDPDRFKPDVQAVSPGGPQKVTCGGGSGSCGTSSSPAPPRATSSSTPVSNPAPPATGPIGTVSAPPAVTPASTPAPPAAPLTPAIGSATNQHKGELTMRGGKVLESSALVAIPAGAAVELLQNDGAWCKVRYQGKEGFVRAYYLGLEKK